MNILVLKKNSTLYKNGIKMVLKSFSIKKLNSYVFKIIRLLSINNVPYSQYSLPIKQKKVTVLRGPHVDKKSREQFEQNTYSYIIILKGLDLLPLKMLYILLLTIRNYMSLEVELKITFFSK